MDEIQPPLAVNDKVHGITLTGKLLPWRRGQPAILSVPKSPYFYVPIFDREEDLRSLLDRADVAFDSIKKVEDGRVFLESVLGNGPDFKVIVNPYFTAEGRVRYIGVKGAVFTVHELG